MTTVELTEFFESYDEVPNQRSATFTDLEMVQKADEYIFDGLAAVYDTETDLGEFTEEVRRGAHRRVLASGINVPFLHEHDPNFLLGTTQSGRVRLLEEARGLRCLANIVKTDLSERVKTLVDSGDVTGMSQGFVVGRGNAVVEYRSGKAHRVIKNFKRLLDVCTTWDPAYASAEAQFRSLTLAQTDPAQSLQQLLTGVYPQLEDGATDELSGTAEAVEVDGEPASGVSSTPLLAARKRRLELLTLTLERGELDEV